MIIQNGKTILFAALIAAMILPFSVMDASAAPNIDKQDIKTQQETLKETSKYAKQLLKSKDYKSLDLTGKKVYLDFLSSLLTSEDVYTKDAIALFDEYSGILMDMEKTQKDKNRKSAIIEELEDLGIVDSEKLADNPEYWLEKARDARDKKNPNVRQVHTSDVSVRNEATVYYPALTNGNGGTISFSTNETTWGPESSSWAYAVALTNGYGSTNAFSCLENTVSHTTVSWYSESLTKYKDWFGNVIDTASYPNSQVTVSGSSTTCTGDVSVKSMTLGYKLEVGHDISNPLTVTGSHA